MKKHIEIFDTSLRDGAQTSGISYTVEDKLKIVKMLDEFGVDYIEGGNPGSNPKDIEFYKRVNELGLKHAKMVAFGSTRRPGKVASEDANVLSLLSANTGAVVIFGKSWLLHVEKVLNTTAEENLEMIKDTLSFCKSKGREVIFDAEHFFDGYADNPEYAIKVLKAARTAGADCLALCDTNGGMTPDRIGEIVAKVCAEVGGRVGIHTHNDNGMATANSIMAVKAGASQIQGTICGVGERCGNDNICSVVPTLQLKLGYECVPEESLGKLTKLAREFCEVANLAFDEKLPYVGGYAFSHKAGMHIDGVSKVSTSYEHVPPESVGNVRQLLMSEMSGRSALLAQLKDIDPELQKESPETTKVLEHLKNLEHEGYQFENATASLELAIFKELGMKKDFFELKYFKVMINEPGNDGQSSSALIKINVGGEEEISAAEGDGPVNALDMALRKALNRFYPEISDIKLTDYKVRVLDSDAATAARVRVFIESTDGKHVWNTIGVSTDIIEASWIALLDSMEYKFLIERGLMRKVER